MKSVKFFSLAFLILIFAFSTLLNAGVPQMINYQGKITTPGGALVDTTVGMTFTIYDDSTTGNVLWADTVGSVSVQKGIFSVLLGSGNPIPDSVFDGNVRYLGTKVGTDAEMSPRKAIVSVGYAYKAEYSDTAEYAQVAVSDGDWTPDTSDINIYRLTGNVGVGTPNPQAKLHLFDPTPADSLGQEALRISGYYHGPFVGSGPYIKFTDGADQFTGSIRSYCKLAASNVGMLFQTLTSDHTPVDALFLDHNGDVGVGTTSPAHKLHVAGSVTIDDTLFTNHVSSRSPLRLQTEGTTRIYIDDISGDVGIGMTNPDSRLYVKGSNALLTVDNTAANTDAGIYLRESGGAYMGKFWYDGSEGLLKIETFPEDRDIYINPGNGGVGIGTTSPTHSLDVSGDVRIRTLPVGAGAPVVVDGVGGLWRGPSSKRYKKNIEALQVDPGRIFELKPVRFNWKTTEQVDIGLIAEDVDEVIPDLVIYDSDGKPDAVKYDKVAIYLLEVVKIQQKRISNLEKQIAELKR